MQIFTVIFLVSAEVTLVFALLSITKVVVRTPKENDIGLIFDVCVTNTDGDSKEVVDFLIRPDGGCFLNLTNTKVMVNASRIVGGNFGSIEPGTVETVSLIWPTLSLYNRVGCCPIILTSTNSKLESSCLKHKLHFDTRFETIDPEGRIFRKMKDFTDCENWDKDYLKNCTPVNCEERYFGHRSFFNPEKEQCEEVARCAQPYEVYDQYANECINTKCVIDDDDIDQIRKGNFEERELCLRPAYAPESPGPDNALNENFVDTVSAQESQQQQQQQPQQVVKDDLDFDIKHNVIREVDDFDDTETSTIPYWLQGLADGLLIVFATIAIYVLICFIIFLIVSWLSRRQSRMGSSLKCVTPTSSEGNIPLFTRSSLMSQR